MDSAYVLSDEELQYPFFEVNEEDAKKIQDWYIISEYDGKIILTEDSKDIVVDPMDILINGSIQDIIANIFWIQNIKPINVNKIIADRFYGWDPEKDDEYTKRYLYLFQKEFMGWIDIQEKNELDFIKNGYENIENFRKFLTTL